MTAEIDQSHRQVELGIRDKLIFDYLGMDRWTPAMAAMLCSGIRAPVGCTEIPGEGISLDNQRLNASSNEFHKARHILRKWNDWREDAEQDGLNSVADEIHPIDFFAWCDDEEIETEWIRLLRLRAGCPIDGMVEEASSFMPSALTKLGPADISSSVTSVAATPFVHKLAQRHNALTTVIAKAIDIAGNSATADVYFQLQKLALEEFPPFTGEVGRDGLVYTDGDKIKTLSKSHLSSRLQRRRPHR